MPRRRTPVKHAILALTASRGRGTLEGVQLAWAKDRDGQKVRASALRLLDRRGRAPFTCVGCGEELIPHLGEVRARHFAHKAGSSCPLTAPETALHLDAKERLLALCADAFAGRRRVSVLARCPVCRRLTPRDLAALGDRAEAEGSVGGLRADVLVRSGDLPALALEVLVTHAVDAEKQAGLAAAGVPAVEIDATEEWEREDGAAARPGQSDDGVAIACARSLGFPPCPACAGASRAEADRARGGEATEIAELEAYRARGLLGSPMGSPGAGASGDPEAPVSPGERGLVAARFRCPECGGDGLEYGQRVVRHPCPAWGAGARPVAWRGYDGTLVELAWWARPDLRPRGPAAGTGRHRPV
jgi:hypothetical protein